ncbi:MAG: hypothetical protein PHC30_10525 [Lentisphaeria bacterium]|nr:hypothetical protein [Lentisphaeria bacterium]
MSSQQHLCPRCGSANLRPASSNYSMPLGCLGALLFGWLGLLAGLLGGENIKLVCLECGHTWPLPGQAGSGAGGCHLLIVFVFAVIAFLGGC